MNFGYKLFKSLEAFLATALSDSWVKFQFGLRIIMDVPEVSISQQKWEMPGK